MNRLQQLYAEQGQSPWLDNLQRGYLTSGQLATLVAEGIRGLTSNPTIFQRAMEGSEDYDDQLADLVKAGGNVVDHYWAMALRDIRGALDVFAPLYESSNGGDGFASVEVAPDLAHDTDGTIASARRLNETIARPNLLVKIPATAEGVPAIRQMISEGRSINVTLIFSLDRYNDVMEAYLQGLEAYDGDLSKVHSVGSFFISRVDTEVDRRLDEIGTPEALALQGQGGRGPGEAGLPGVPRGLLGPALGGAAPARREGAAAAVGLHLDEEPRLPRHALRRQPHRPRHREHPARQDHRRLQRPRHGGPHGRRRTSTTPRRPGRPCSDVGVDMDDVARVLEQEGVASFQKSFDELLGALSTKSAELRANDPN